MALSIVRYNQPILRQAGKKVSRFDAELAELAGAMIEAMHEADGIGLAAQQVGRARLLCVVDLRGAKPDFGWTLDGAHPPLELFMPMVLVNPVIELPEPIDYYAYEEGCLSFPNIRGDVIRPDRINVRFQDLAAVSHSLECDGLLARCIQHEVDHLNGILFIDRMEKPDRARLDPEIRALARETRQSQPAT